MRGKVNIYVPCLIWRKNLLDLEFKRNEKEEMEKNVLSLWYVLSGVCSTNNSTRWDYK